MKFLDRAAVSYQVVLTKMDQVRVSDHAQHMQTAKAVISRHVAARSDVLATSAESKDGMDALRGFLATCAAKSP